jgi:peptide-methionine (R)-S-oxide reductase
MQEYREGTYQCAGCGNSVFSSSAKFNSGTGWCAWQVCHCHARCCGTSARSQHIFTIAIQAVTIAAMLTNRPSFYQALPDAVRETRDTSIPFLPRTEITCSRCSGHLGHVFNDGPPPTGLR